MSVAGEHTSFIGKQIPSEVKLLSKQLKTPDYDTYVALVKVASTMLSTTNPSNEQFSMLVKDINESSVNTLYPGILKILTRALRLPTNNLKKKEFVQDLNELNIPAKCHTPLLEVLFSEKRAIMDDCLLETRPRFSHANSFRWRIDVGISTTSLKRALEPIILCNIKTTDDKDYTFEMTKEKFHELRYSVAEVLNHMQQLEKRSVLKIET